MINACDVSTEDQLADILARCGYASESPAASKLWHDWQTLQHLSVARHLTVERCRGVFVAVEGRAFQVYWVNALVCTLSGEVSEDELMEKLELAASPDRAPGKWPCICLDLPLPFNHYETVRRVGIDKTQGRFGRVTVQRCRHCGQSWLHYFVEYEAFAQSGRNFMGLITPEMAETISPEMAVDYVESLDWHLYGGSYFGRKGKSTIKPIDVDG